MNTENRTYTRYKDIGHIIAPELCVLPGIIDDISLSGCKVHYQFPVVIDLDNEYEVKLSPSQNPNENPLNLMCKPQWAKEIDGKTYYFDEDGLMVLGPAKDNIGNEYFFSYDTGEMLKGN